MTTDDSKVEDISVTGIAVTSIVAMALLVAVGVIGLVCCKKRKPEMDTNITAGNEGHYAKRSTTLFTNNTGPHNNAVTMHLRDVPVVKYDKKLDSDSNLAIEKPPLNVSVTSKTKLVVIEDDSDYAVIGHDDGASTVDRLSASVAVASEGETIQTVDVEMFDEINYEDDYAILDGDVRTAPIQKLSSAVEGSKVGSRRSDVGSDTNLKIEETKFVDEYATIVPKSLRIKDPSKLKLMAIAVSDQDTPDHDIRGVPDSSSIVDHRVSSQTDVSGNLNSFDPHSTEPFRNISSEQGNVDRNTNNSSLTLEREDNSTESALQKLHFLLDEHPSDTEENAVILPGCVENHHSTPSSQTVRSHMDTRLSKPHANSDSSPLQPQRLFELSL